MSPTEQPENTAANTSEENPPKDYSRIFIGILQGSGFQSASPHAPYIDPNLDNVRAMVKQLGVMEVTVADPRFWQTFDALNTTQQNAVRRGIQTITGIALDTSRPGQE